jgi:hypothetical protein
MNKKPTEQELAYEEQKARNEYAFKEMLKSVKPEMFVLFDVLEQTGVNWFVVIKIIRALNNIAIGNGYGTVSVTIENGRVMFVRGEESDRLMNQY